MVENGESRDKAREVVSQDGPKMLCYLAPFHTSKHPIVESDERIRE